MFDDACRNLAFVRQQRNEIEQQEVARNSNDDRGGTKHHHSWGRAGSGQ